MSSSDFGARVETVLAPSKHKKSKVESDVLVDDSSRLVSLRTHAQLLTHTSQDHENPGEPSTTLTSPPSERTTSPLYSSL